MVKHAHSTDDATLDLLKFLGRRIERTHALLAVGYRDDEVCPTHALRRVLGELPQAQRTPLAEPRPALQRGVSRCGTGMRALSSA